MERAAEGSGDTGNIPQTRTFPSVAHHGAAAEPSRADLHLPTFSAGMSDESAARGPQH